MVVPLIFKKCVVGEAASRARPSFSHYGECDECRFEQDVNGTRLQCSGVSVRDCAFDDTVSFEDTCFARREKTYEDMADTHFSGASF